MSRVMKLARSDELPEGEARIFEVDEDLRVALCKVDGEIFALEDVCPHDDGPLGEGCLRGHEIECPRHGARFDVRSGAVTRMPAPYPVSTFAVRVEDGDVLVELED